MLFATVSQARLFVWMMAAGAVVGAWYALTALLRRILQAGFWLTLACDLLFGAGSAVILIAALVAGNYGQARPFEILARCAARRCSASALPRRSRPCSGAFNASGAELCPCSLKIV